jgi:rod shape-determining protein MreC
MKPTAMKRQERSLLRVALPVRLWFGHFSFILLLGLSLLLIILDRAGLPLIERARQGVMDGLAPLFNVLATPAGSVAALVEEGHDWLRLYEENITLRQEKAELLRWQMMALRLEAENKDLRQLLNFRQDPPLAYVSARVIAQNASPFTQQLLLNRGTKDGVRKGLVAAVGDVVIGRVADVSYNAARLILLTDANLRLPVMLESSRQRGMLAGDNSTHPRLLYLAAGITPDPGERVITSAYETLIPAGLPVGTIYRPGALALGPAASTDKGGGGAAAAPLSSPMAPMPEKNDEQERILPFIDLSRVDYVRIIIPNQTQDWPPSSDSLANSPSTTGLSPSYLSNTP